LPILRPVVARIESDLVEVLGIEVVAITVEPQRVTVGFAVLGGAGHERGRVVVGKGLERRIAKARHVEWADEALVEPDWHEPILTHEPFGRGAGSESYAELLAEIPERKPLEVNYHIRVFLHEQLDALVEPRALLRVVEGPEGKTDRRFALRVSPASNRACAGGESGRADSTHQPTPADGGSGEFRYLRCGDHCHSSHVFCAAARGPFCHLTPLLTPSQAQMPTPQFARSDTP